jgi:hypothetical protein
MLETDQFNPGDSARFESHRQVLLRRRARQLSSGGGALNHLIPKNQHRDRPLQRLDTHEGS